MASETLASLATIIVREHQLTYQSAYDALTHATACGQALLRSQQSVPEGSWQMWVRNTTGLTPGVAQRFMRIARNRDLLERADRRLETINAAIEYLHEIEAPRASTGRTGKRPTFDVEEAKRLREQGMTYREISKRVGVSDVAIARQISPEQKQRSVERTSAAAKRRRDRQRQAEQQERTGRVQRTGGTLAEAYNLLVRSLAVLEHAAGVSRGNKQLATAINHIRKAMRAIESAI